MSNCIATRSLAMNTFFSKPPDKLAAYRAPGALRGPPFRRGPHEMLDYVLAQQRWKNRVRNVESHTTANFASDHYPVVATLEIRLKQIHKPTGHERRKYLPCSDEQRQAYNEYMRGVGLRTARPQTSPTSCGRRQRAEYRSSHRNGDRRRCPRPWSPSSTGDDTS